MRWSYLIPRVLLLVGLIAYVRYGLDPTLRWSGEFAAETASGRETELEAVRTTLWPPTFEATTLDVANAEADAAEVRVGRVRVAMNADAVKHRRAVAEEVVVEGLRWDVPAEFEVTPEEVEEAGETPAWLADLQQRGADALASQLDAIEGRVKEKLDPERLETLRLAKSKEAEYRGTLDTLEAEYEYLRTLTERIKTLAEDKDARRQLLMQPDRMEAAVRESAAAKQRIAVLRTQVAELRTRLPADFRELNAAKDADLQMVAAEWRQMKENPIDATALIVGQPVADAMQTLSRWWPHWRKFREASEWDELQHVEGRGRTIAFLPEHAGPTAGVDHMLMSGVATRDGQEWPFRCEMNRLHYPADAEHPATFHWSSGGDVPVEAVGFVAMTDDGPGLKLQFRVQDTRPVNQTTRVSRATVAFRSGPPVLEGTLTAGAEMSGTCRVRLPGATARLSGDDPRLSSLLSAFNLDVEELVPVVDFGYAGGRPDCRIACDQLSGVGEQWKAGLSRAADTQLASLQAEARTLIEAKLASFGEFGPELAALSQAVPGLKVADVAGLVRGGKIDTKAVTNSVLENDAFRQALRGKKEKLLRKAGFETPAEGDQPDPKNAAADALLKSIFR